MSRIINFTVTVRTESGRSEKVELPPEMKVGEFIDQLLDFFQDPQTDKNGKRIPWIIDDENSKRTLDPNKSLQDEGVRNEHVLHLLRGLQIWVGRRGGDSHARELPRNLTVKELIANEMPKLGRDTGKPWRVFDQELDKTLELEKTLQSNGVANGHHLYFDPDLHIVETAWKRKAAIAALALVVVLGIIWWVIPPGPPVVVTLTPMEASLSASQQHQFTAGVEGPENKAVIWSANPAIGTISQDGVYTAPPTIETATTVSITATSDADRNKYVTATITLNPSSPIAVDVNPKSIDLGISEQSAFTATVTGSNNTNVIWSLDPATGTISEDGRYVAPPSIGGEQTVTVTVTAKSAADATKAATSTINLKPVTVSLNPPEAQVSARGRTAFKADVTGTSNTDVTWSLSGPGRILPTGEYVAPESVSVLQNVQVTAMSNADPTKTVTATVRLMPAISDPRAPLVLDVSSIALGVSERYQFSATFNGGTPSPLRWSLSGPGSISGNGRYTAPASIPSEQLARVTATVASDPARSASANVTLRPLIVNLTPNAVDARPGQRINFEAKVQWSPRQEVRWSLSGPDQRGEVSDRGVYTAPNWIEVEHVVRLTATSRADSSRSDSVAITLRPYAGRMSGTFTWTSPGQVQQNQVFTIEGRSASIAGDLLPGIPVEIDLENDRDFEVRERPNVSNGWRRLTIRSKNGNASTLRINWEVDR